MSVIAIQDPQPPLSYLSYRIWGRMVGITPLSMRSYSMLMSVLSIPIFLRLCQIMTPKRSIYLLATFMWSFHPLVIWHAQDARTYTLWLTTNLLATWLALCALKINRLINWIIYIAAAICAIYSYYLEIFTLIALTFYILINHINQFHKWLKVLLSIVIFALPWYSYIVYILYTSDESYYGTTDAFQLNKILSTFSIELIFGYNLPVSLSNHLGILVTVFIVIAILYSYRNNPTWLYF